MAAPRYHGAAPSTESLPRQSDKRADNTASKSSRSIAQPFGGRLRPAKVIAGAVGLLRRWRRVVQKSSAMSGRLPLSSLSMVTDRTLRARLQLRSDN